MKKLIILVIIAAAAFAAWWFLLRAPALPQDSADTIQQQAAVPTRTYTAADLQAHASAQDCWMALGGTVYDATSLVASSSFEAFVPACGTDATAFFAGRPIAEQDEAQVALFAGSPLGTFAQ